MPARLLLVDDHPLFLAGLRTLLVRDATFTVVAEAATTGAALECATQARFDAALVDVVIPDDGGPAVVRALHAQQPDCKILALSMLDDSIRVAQMLRAGASGYALKSEPVENIIAGLRAVLGGVRYLSPTIAASEVEQLLAAKHLPLEALTARERSVFDLLVRGGTSAQIAERLEIAQSTVETHRRHIMAKLEAGSVVDLIHLAVSHGVCP